MSEIKEVAWILVHNESPGSISRWQLCAALAQAGVFGSPSWHRAELAQFWLNEARILLGDAVSTQNPRLLEPIGLDGYPNLVPLAVLDAANTRPYESDFLTQVWFRLVDNDDIDSMRKLVLDPGIDLRPRFYFDLLKRVMDTRRPDENVGFFWSEEPHVCGLLQRIVTIVGKHGQGMRMHPFDVRHLMVEQHTEDDMEGNFRIPIAWSAIKAGYTDALELILSNFPLCTKYRPEWRAHVPFDNDTEDLVVAAIKCPDPARRERMCRLLVNSGIPLNYMDERGWFEKGADATPLMVAAAMGSEDVCGLLLQHGVDPMWATPLTRYESDALRQQDGLQPHPEAAACFSGLDSWRVDSWRSRRYGPPSGSSAYTEALRHERWGIVRMFEDWKMARCTTDEEVVAWVVERALIKAGVDSKNAQRIKELLEERQGMGYDDWE